MGFLKTLVSAACLLIGRLVASLLALSLHYLRRDNRIALPDASTPLPDVSTPLLDASTLGRRQTHWLFMLPDELIVEIASLLTFKDRLSFADTCAYCRCFVSHTDCVIRCIQAGLSLPNRPSLRAMAKLLVQPRVGMCNWSNDDGKPKQRKKGMR